MGKSLLSEALSFFYSLSVNVYRSHAKFNTWSYGTSKARDSQANIEGKGATRKQSKAEQSKLRQVAE